MPTPPAFSTARLLLTRGLVPRVQITTLPLTLAGSRATWPATGVRLKSAGVKHRLALPPPTPASSARIRGDADSALGLSEAPVYLAPLPSVTSPSMMRSWVAAATVVSQGLGWLTVSPGPLLPAAAATNTPASAAR